MPFVYYYLLFYDCHLVSKRDPVVVAFLNWVSSSIGENLHDATCPPARQTRSNSNSPPKAGIYIPQLLTTAAAQGRRILGQPASHSLPSIIA